MALLEVEDLQVVLGRGRASLRAVDGVSLVLERGEVLALVGESGSGKTALCLGLLGLLPGPAGRAIRGSIRLEQGDDAAPLELVGASAATLRSVRGRRIAMVFQDPMTALNPYLRVGLQVGETLAHHHGVRGERLRARVVKALAAMGLPRPEEIVNRYPHELSGGMRQRVLLASALAAEPDVLIADEPTTALDVTIQAQVLDLVAARVRDRALAVLWVTHDFGVVARLAHRVAVMYAGRIVEQGPVDALLDRPAHPYTQALRAAVAWLDEPSEGERRVPEGSSAGGHELPSGCPFRERCPRAVERCANEEPAMHAVIGHGHLARCHLAEEGR